MRYLKLWREIEIFSRWPAVSYKKRIVEEMRIHAKYWMIEITGSRDSEFAVNFISLRVWWYQKNGISHLISFTIVDVTTSFSTAYQCFDSQKSLSSKILDHWMFLVSVCVCQFDLIFRFVSGQVDSFYDVTILLLANRMHGSKRGLPTQLYLPLTLKESSLVVQV